MGVGCLFHFFFTPQLGIDIEKEKRESTQRVVI